MLALLTACDRSDLLDRTIESLFKNLPPKLITTIYLNDDSKKSPVGISCFDKIPEQYQYDCSLAYKPTLHKGQHSSIKEFLTGYKESYNEFSFTEEIISSKYYLHLEDDWEFTNSYDWITESIRIMESDPTIIKVICRSDSPHPCEFKNGYGILEPWTDPWKENLWHGFGWNPGVTRLDLLKQFLSFPKTEQELSKEIYEAGYKTALLENGVCIHIGQDQSTHEN